MNVRIEFYGIPRSRAGTGAVTLQTDGGPIRLGDVLLRLAERFPDLAEECFDGRQLKPSVTANLGGDRFVTDAAAVIQSGDCLLIMSADAGG